MFGSCAAESETAGVFAFASLEAAYRRCRRRKRHTRNTQRYEVRLLDHLWTTVERLEQRVWSPSRSVFFIALKPKAREIHAADFGDRVVHHALVPALEALYEPRFIHDSYGNRVGKGTHKAVVRLRAFMHSTLQRHGCAYFLQLDVRNFFNSIDRELLLELLRRGIAKGLRRGRIDRNQARELYWACRVILKTDPAQDVYRKGPAWTFDRVPEYKRLAAMGPGKGLSIGNLTSQFFANVYLNELDQFVKHELRCRCYLRYVDDLVLVHHDPKQLARWHERIGAFLRERLFLELKPGERLQPVEQGADFLGYVIRPRYVLVRRRVVGQLRDKLRAFESRLVLRARHGICLHLEPGLRDGLRATLASYLGHLKHADAVRLTRRIWEEFPWLRHIFVLHFEPGGAAAVIAYWEPRSVASFSSQWRWFHKQRPDALTFLQVGRVVEVYDRDVERLRQALPWTRRIRPADADYRRSHPLCLTLRPGLVKRLCRQLRIGATAYQRVAEEGYLKGGIKRRVLRQLYIPSPVATQP